MKEKNISFTAASTLPIKVLLKDGLIKEVKEHRIKPLHMQINPTNRCQLKCSFCSCDNRKKDLTIPFKDLKKIIVRFRDLGTKAITITGGGDPLLYPAINDLLELLIRLNIKIGFVTNGLAFSKINKNLFKEVTWCRLSISDELKFNEDRYEDIINIPIDWSFSYVITKKLDESNLGQTVSYANRKKFTHVRIVNDIIDPSHAINMDTVKLILHDMEVNDERVIYQGRKEYSKGNKVCLISLLKPNIDANGSIFPCCGIQYATENPLLDFNEIFSMGSNIEEIYSEQKYFNGTICKKCYYAEYNNILEILWNGDKIKHKDFI